MPSQRRTIGPFTVIGKLGEGSNAVVYRAERRGDPDVALKVLNATNVHREPYRRFVQEVQTLEKLRDFAGVLQLIDFHLPDSPSKDDPAWLAMPCATLIANALESEPLEAVIAAVRAIAGTLERLKREHGIGHRDIKPKNLYEMSGAWLVGDFGLVAAPDLDELTRSGKPIGPAHFTAYEMIRDPVNANAHPADVYSLGKTIWVLATEQSFPPDGHQPAGTRDLSIADLRPHPHAGVLDGLVDRMTMIHPEARPTIDQVAIDLDAWLALAAEPVRVDVGQARERLRAKIEKQLAQEDLEEIWKEQALDAVRLLQRLAEPLNQALKDVHPRAQIDMMAERYVQNMLRAKQFDQSEDSIFRWHRQSQIALGHPHMLWVVRFGRGLELQTDGELAFRALIDVGYTSVMGGPRFDWQSGARSAPVGSVQLEKVLETAINDAAEQLPAALDVFIEHVPDGSS
jgi:serine/threonine protein kinase